MSEYEKITYLILGLIAVIAFVVWIVILSNRKNKERGEALEQGMMRFGLSFHADSDESAGKLLAPHPLGKCGSPKGATKVGRGNYHDHEVVIFEYTYMIHTGKSSHAVIQTVVILKNEQNFPDLDMGSESFFDRFKEYFGAQDIDFSSNPGFSRKYRLRGDDEYAICDLFRPQVLEYFENHDKIQLDIKGDQILIYQPGKYCKSAEDLELLLNRAVEIKNLFAGKRR
ncbi:MAG: hypothetical protein VX404_04590 [Planctomycetota bacterium]|nr:hypothetical protein [Planctomycetota bacterium]